MSDLELHQGFQAHLRNAGKIQPGDSSRDHFWGWLSSRDHFWDGDLCPPFLGKKFGRELNDLDRKVTN